jgi:uncharacterized delta-60 repeat protein
LFMRVTVLLMLLVQFETSLYSQSYPVDPDPLMPEPVFYEGNAYGIKPAQAGGFFLYGTIRSYAGKTAPSLIRVDSTGKLLQAYWVLNFQTVWDVLELPDGSIVAGGAFPSANPQGYRAIVKLNADGTLDSGFQDAAILGTVKTLGRQSDGKIIGGGMFASAGGKSLNNIVRLNTNGSFDATFPQGAGFTGTGTVEVSSIAIDSQDRIYAGGAFTKYNGANRALIARLLANGALDTGYNPVIPYNSGPYYWTDHLRLDTNNRLIATGTFSTLVIRFLQDGRSDNAFNTNVRDALFYGNYNSPESPVWTYNAPNDKMLLVARKAVRIKDDGSRDASFADLDNNPGYRRAAFTKSGRILMTRELDGINQLQLHRGGETESKLEIAPDTLRLLTADFERVFSSDTVKLTWSQLNEVPLRIHFSGGDIPVTMTPLDVFFETFEYGVLRVSPSGGSARIKITPATSQWPGKRFDTLLVSTGSTVRKRIPLALEFKKNDPQLSISEQKISIRTGEGRTFRNVLPFLATYVYSDTLVFSTASNSHLLLAAEDTTSGWFSSTPLRFTSPGRPAHPSVLTRKIWYRPNPALTPGMYNDSIRVHLSDSLMAVIPVTIQVLAPVPALHRLARNSASPGDTLTIFGERLATDPQHAGVFFGTASAEVLASSETKLLVKVPPGQAAVNVRFTNLSTRQTAASTLWFLPTGDPRPRITAASFFPAVVSQPESETAFEVLGFFDIDKDGVSEKLALDAAAKLNVFKIDAEKPGFYETNPASVSTWAFARSLNSFKRLSVEDINNDGAPDLLLIHPQTEKLWIALATAPGNWSDPVLFSTTFAIRELPKVFDVNLDGLSDLVFLSKYNGMLHFYLNQNPSSTAINADDYIAMNPISRDYYVDFQFADLNGDGRPEFIGLRSGEVDMYRVLESRESLLTFSNPVSLPYSLRVSGGYKLTTGDYQNDGLTDIVVFGDYKATVFTEFDRDGNRSTSVSWSDTPGTVSERAEYLETDWNGDGMPDFFVLDRTEEGQHFVRLFAARVSSGRLWWPSGGFFLNVPFSVPFYESSPFKIASTAHRNGTPAGFTVWNEKGTSSYTGYNTQPAVLVHTGPEPWFHSAPTVANPKTAVFSTAYGGDSVHVTVNPPFKLRRTTTSGWTHRLSVVTFAGFLNQITFQVGLDSVPSGIYVDSVRITTGQATALIPLKASIYDMLKLTSYTARTVLKNDTLQITGSALPQSREDAAVYAGSRKAIVVESRADRISFVVPELSMPADLRIENTRAGISLTVPGYLIPRLRSAVTDWYAAQALNAPVAGAASRENLQSSVWFDDVTGDGKNELVAGFDTESGERRKQLFTVADDGTLTPSETPDWLHTAQSYIKTSLIAGEKPSVFVISNELQVTVYNPETHAPVQTITRLRDYVRYPEDALKQLDFENDGFADIIFATKYTVHRIRYSAAAKRYEIDDLYEGNDEIEWLKTGMLASGVPYILLSTKSGIRMLTHSAAGVVTTHISSETFTLQPWIADVNGDGFDDIIFPSLTSVDYVYKTVLHLHYGRKNGFHTQAVVLTPFQKDVGAGIAYIGDLHGDELPEIVLADYFDPVRTVLTRTKENPAYTVYTATNGEVNTLYPVFIDLDNDGKPDVVSTKGDGVVYVEKGKSGPVINTQVKRVHLTRRDGGEQPATSFSISAFDVEGPLTVTAPPGIELGKSAESFAETALLINPVNTGTTDIITNALIYVRLAAGISASFSDSIRFSINGNPLFAMPLSVTIVPAPVAISSETAKLMPWHATGLNLPLTSSSTTGTIVANWNGSPVKRLPSENDVLAFEKPPFGGKNLFSVIDSSGKVTTQRHIGMSAVAARSIQPNDFVPSGFIQSVNLKYSSSMPVIYDMDGDGRLDILFFSTTKTSNWSDFNVDVLVNASSLDKIVFNAQTVSGLVWHRGGTVADLDHDGKGDLILYGDGSLVVLKNTSAPGVISFGKPTFIPMPGRRYVSHVEIADIDGDGLLEIIAGSGPYNPFLAILGTDALDLTAGDFAGSLIQLTIPDEAQASMFTVHDATGDTKPDILLLGNASPSKILLLKNNSSPGEILPNSFSIHTLNQSSSDFLSYSGVSVADTDGNGRNEWISLRRNDNGSFVNTSSNVHFDTLKEAPVASGFSSIPIPDWTNFDGYTGSPLVLEDFDGDGRSEIITPGLKPTMISNGKQTPLTNLPNNSLVLPVDINNDGRIDLVAVSGSYDYSVSVFLNKVPLAVGALVTPFWTATTLQKSTFSKGNAGFAFTAYAPGHAQIQLKLPDESPLTFVVDGKPVSDIPAFSLQHGMHYNGTFTLGAVSGKPLAGKHPVHFLAGDNIIDTHFIEVRERKMLEGDKQVLAVPGKTIQFGINGSSPAGTGLRVLSGIRDIPDFTLENNILTATLPKQSMYGTITVIDSANNGADAVGPLMIPSFNGTRERPVFQLSDEKNSIVPGPSGIFAFDADNDGTLEQVYHSQISILVTRPNAVPRVELESSEVITGAMAADVNADGFPDLVFRTQRGISIGQNNGKRGEKLSDIVSLYKVDGIPAMAPEIHIADVTLDGIPDIVGYTNAQALTVWTGGIDKETGRFFSAAVSRIQLPEQVRTLDIFSILVQDVTGDGAPDLIIANGNALVLPNRSEDGPLRFGTGGEMSLLASSITSSHIQAADFNKDGKMDLVFSSSYVQNQFQAHVFLNTSDTDSTGVFRTTDPVLIPADLARIGIADFNGDGWPDIAATYSFSIIICTNRIGSGGSFEQQSFSASYPPNRAISILDLNNDDRPDITVLSPANYRVMSFVNGSAFAVAVEDPKEPHAFALHQNFPNPFNPTTTIAFSLEKAGEVRLEVFDITGRQVATVVNARFNAGKHQVVFDASRLSSGVYLYKLTQGTQTIHRKMLLMK